jgi:hypothetical protein
MNIIIKLGKEVRKEKGGKGSKNDNDSEDEGEDGAASHHLGNHLFVIYYH